VTHERSLLYGNFLEHWDETVLYVVVDVFAKRMLVGESCGNLKTVNLEGFSSADTAALPHGRVRRFFAL